MDYTDISNELTQYLKSNNFEYPTYKLFISDKGRTDITLNFVDCDSKNNPSNKTFNQINTVFSSYVWTYIKEDDFQFKEKIIYAESSISSEYVFPYNIILVLHKVNRNLNDSYYEIFLRHPEITSIPNNFINYNVSVTTRESNLINKEGEVNKEKIYNIIIMFKCIMLVLLHEK